ncbi:2-phospho-L-lactate guanylyltransferase [Microbacterium soli]|uniref:2-phospho-L-lactate guanylyltransferase n=1 Tax=Microbacterium soli TaxID=446075 RepID=A0ABP7N2V5_9MICO
MSGPEPPRWSIVIPVKAASIGKSRLRIDGADHERLARAIALDTIHAAARCAAVTGIRVVTADAALRRELDGIRGVTVVADSGEGLNAALRTGLAAAGERTDRAVLLGDLPALQTVELEVALGAAAGFERAFVPDADLTGTVLATARRGVELTPLFGPRSADAHRRAGFVPVAMPARSGLRRDVDLAAHLRAVRRLGPRTRAALPAGARAASQASA